MGNALPPTVVVLDRAILTVPLDTAVLDLTRLFLVEGEALHRASEHLLCLPTLCTLCSTHKCANADLYIRIYDSINEREGIQAALDVLRMMMKPGLDTALERGPPKPCHLTSGAPISSLTLSILKLVQVRNISDG